MASIRKALLGLPIVGVVVLPRARELIGDDAHPARLGLACGSTEISGGTGTASWSLPYTGSRGRGDVSFDAHKRGGEWIVHRAELEVGDETIDLVQCSGGTSTSRVLAQTNADAASANFGGKVIRSNHATIVQGSTCSGTLVRERGSPTARVSVSCWGGAAESTGEVSLYDGRGGFTLDVADATRRDDDRSEYDDSKTTDHDGTPGCRLSGNGNSATLTVWDPSFEIVVAL